MTTNVSQIELVAAIFKFLDCECGVAELRERETNTIARCATEIVDELAQPDRPAESDMGLQQWLASDETGLSSRYMAGVFDGHPAEYSYPRDPADFGRCLGLLDAVPEFRGLLNRMSETGPEWAAIVEAWDELEMLYKEESPSGRAPKLYQRMKELID